MHVYIVNPNAIPTRSWHQTHQRIEAMYQKQYSSTEFCFEYSTSKQDVETKTQSALLRGATTIIAVGGDGTIQTVVKSLFAGHSWRDPTCSVALLRAGSGSDYIRTVCPANQKLTPAPGQDTQWVDVGRCIVTNANDDDFTDCIEYLFVNMASLGLTADIVKCKEAWQHWLPRWARYILPTLATFPYRQEQTYHWSADSGAQQLTLGQDLLALTIGKGRFAGGGMKLSENSELDSGLLEITLFEPHSLWAFLLKLPKLYRGGLWHSRGIHKLTTETFQVRLPNGVCFELDGELQRLPDDKSTLHFSTLHQALPLNIALTHQLRNATGR